MTSKQAINKQIVLMGLQSADGVGNKKQWGVLNDAQARSIALETIGEMDAQALQDVLGLNAKIATAIAQVDWQAIQALHKQLEKDGIQVIGGLDAAYPARLKQSLQNGAPPILYVRGDVSLLNQPAIAFSGSRKVTKSGLVYTEKLVEQAVARKLLVVSGHAPGVDVTAHQVAVAAGGKTALVLPEGVLKFRLRPELRDLYQQQPDAFVVVSTLPPQLPWKSHHAMSRNQTIIGLSDAVCVIEADTQGGTINAGEMTLKHGTPLFVLQYDDPPPNAMGNALLIANGATPIPTETLVLPDLVQAKEQAQPPRQLGLFDDDTT